jgi:spore coat protein CotH
MKKIKLLILTSAACLSLSSCSLSFGGNSQLSSSSSETTSSSTSETTTSEATLETTSETSSEDISSSSENNNEEDNYEIALPNFETRLIASKNDVTYDDFFNLGNTISINIDISNDELQKIQDDYETKYKSEIYHRADKVTISLTNYSNTFTWEFENVGIRQKGNTSRNEIFNDDGYLNLNHYKLSFDETFTDTEAYDASYIATYGDETLNNRDFLGLSGLDIKWNKNYDGSHIREAYASYIYRASGILSQHIGLTKMTITQTDSSYVNDFGLCTVFEPATKSLIKNALKSSDKYINMSSWNVEKAGLYGVSGEKYGDLYKASYGVGEGSNSGAKMTSNSASGKRVGVGNLSGSYIPAYERKTNKNVDYDDSLIRNAFSVFDNKNYSSISNVVDLEYLAIEEAVSYFVCNPDSLRNNYNNYQLYFRRTDGKMIIIPIDNDRCFGITKDFDPFGNGGANVDFYSNKDCWGNTNENPLLQATIMTKGTKAREIYTNFAKALVDSSWLDVNTFNQYVNKAKNSYSEYDFDSESNNLTFENYLNQKLSTFKSAVSDNNSSEGENTNTNSKISWGDVTKLAILGTHNGWSGSEGDLFTKKEGNIYSCTITVKYTNNGQIEMKIGTYPSSWNPNNYSIDFNTGYVVENNGNSSFPEEVKEGDQIYFELDISTGAITYTVL